MTWNYRVRRTVTELGTCKDVCFDIIEVHYDDKGNPDGWCERRPLSDTLEGLNETLIMMKAARWRPVLEVVEGDALREVAKQA